jgi:hypothetical protein
MSVSFEVRNRRRGLDIELFVSGAVVAATVEEVVRRTGIMATREPSQLRVDFAGADIDPAAIEPLVVGLHDARRVMERHGGTLVVTNALELDDDLGSMRPR